MSATLIGIGALVVFVAAPLGLSLYRRIDGKLQRLSAFPRLSPFPVVELSPEGIRFANATALRLAENLSSSTDIEMILPSDWKALVQEQFEHGAMSRTKREVELGGETLAPTTASSTRACADAEEAPRRTLATSGARRFLTSLGRDCARQNSNSANSAARAYKLAARCGISVANERASSSTILRISAWRSGSQPARRSLRPSQRAACTRSRTPDPASLNRSRPLSGRTSDRSFSCPST